jgi:eukaryotic-like serine/threonine-protein kinase
MTSKQAELRSCLACGAALPVEAVVCPACGARAPSPVPMKDSPEVLDGHWRLERKLGKGGMGTVYLAHDLELERQVAIKMLAPQYCDDPGLVQRFEREARMMAKLDHPNLVPVYSVGRTPKGPYIVMKLLDGVTLAEALKSRGRMSVHEVLLVTRQVAAGLQFIHDRQVVHRDVKPANIFVGPDGHVTLLDLGVARDSTSDLTRTGVLLGTPRYMSPEQIHGQPADHRSDLYALATVVYEM